MSLAMEYLGLGIGDTVEIVGDKVVYQILLKKELGEGTCAIVLLGKDLGARSGHIEVALKVSKFTEVEADPVTWSALVAEGKSRVFNDCPTMVPILDRFLFRGRLGLIMPAFSEGTLADLLSQYYMACQRVPDHVILAVALDVGLALQHVHSQDCALM